MASQLLSSPHLYLVLLTTLSAIALATTFTVSIAEGHIKVEDWPSLSDIVTRPPESCLFTFLSNCCIALIALIVLVRFKQVKASYRIQWVSRAVNRLNEASLYVGWTFSFCLAVATCFLPVANVRQAAAIAGFGFGIAWFWLQVLSSHKVVGACKTFWLQLTLAVAVTCALTIAVTTRAVANLGWSSSIWSLRVVSSIHEWILVMAFNSFFLTFLHEFKNVSVKVVVLQSREDENYQTLDDESASLDADAEEGEQRAAAGHARFD